MCVAANDSVYLWMHAYLVVLGRKAVLAGPTVYGNFVDQVFLNRCQDVVELLDLVELSMILGVD